MYRDKDEEERKGEERGGGRGGNDETEGDNERETSMTSRKRTKRQGRKTKKKRKTPLGVNVTVNLDTNIFFHLHVLDFALLPHAAARGGKRITSFRRYLLPSSSRLDSDFEQLIRNNEVRNSISKAASHPQL
jgi:hypothetical protein